MESSGAIEKCFDIRFQTGGRHLGAVIFLPGKEAVKNGTVRKKGIAAFSLVFFSFNTGVQETVVLGLLPLFASVYPPTAISAGFPLPLCRQRSPWPPAGYFANNGSLKKRFRSAIFLDARIHVMHVRGQFCDAIVREG